MDLFFGQGAAWFAIPAIIGSAVFILRFSLALIGGHVGDLDVGMEVHDLSAHHGDPTDAFKWLSFQSIAAFVMGFGWGGLASLKGTGWSWPISVLVAVCVGVAMVWLLGLSLKAVYDLQSSGNVNAVDTVGVEGDVYLSIPPIGADKSSGLGKVRLILNKRQRLFNAVAETHDGQDIPTHTRVRVVRVNDDNSLTVARA